MEKLNDIAKELVDALAQLNRNTTQELDIDELIERANQAIEANKFKPIEVLVRQIELDTQSNAHFTLKIWDKHTVALFIETQNLRAAQRDSVAVGLTNQEATELAAILTTLAQRKPGTQPQCTREVLIAELHQRAHALERVGLELFGVHEVTRGHGQMEIARCLRTTANHLTDVEIDG